MIKENDLIFLYYDTNRNYLLRAKPQKFHTDKGYLDIGKIIGKEYGDKIKTNLGFSFYILKPTLYELVMKLKRHTQIIYPKELGMILIKGGIFPGAKVIEAGTGSGALTSTLAYFVRPDGRVFSYERNLKFLNNAKKNIEKNGLSEWVVFKHKEVINEFDEQDIDFIMIDIGSPWTLIDAAYKSLKKGGRLCTICPTFEQLTKTVFSLEEKGFVYIETIEIIVRRILVRKGKTRPEQRIPSHTGFLIFASKIEI